MCRRRGATRSTTRCRSEASRRFSNGLQFTASYTFSKTIDDGSGAFATEQIYQSLRLDRALADTDVRNRFVFSGVYELPFGHGKRFANNLSKPLETIVGGWQMNTIVTVQSGLPFTSDYAGVAVERPAGFDRHARHTPRQHAALLRHERGRGGAHQ